MLNCEKITLKAKGQILDISVMQLCVGSSLDTKDSFFRPIVEARSRLVLDKVLHKLAKVLVNVRSRFILDRAPPKLAIDFFLNHFSLIKFQSSMPFKKVQRYP